ncbi:hypothetical protein CEXT_134401 [Caerostris extrusa]|uniref:Uncharacterized protein n=1 Tax=Caerostris extrusa TaxID=172846 RepID=A0AAV4X2W8_CAEEX|nr:hypothetical protein CEXT_134401 [Caerostris extrusa]
MVSDTQWLSSQPVARTTGQDITVSIPKIRAADLVLVEFLVCAEYVSTEEELEVSGNSFNDGALWKDLICETGEGFRRIRAGKSLASGCVRCRTAAWLIAMANGRATCRWGKYPDEIMPDSNGLQENFPRWGTRHVANF